MRHVCVHTRQPSVSTPLPCLCAATETAPSCDTVRRRRGARRRPRVLLSSSSSTKSRVVVPPRAASRAVVSDACLPTGGALCSCRTCWRRRDERMAATWTSSENSAASWLTKYAAIRSCWGARWCLSAGRRMCCLTRQRHSRRDWQRLLQLAAPRRRDEGAGPSRSQGTAGLDRRRRRSPAEVGRFLRQGILDRRLQPWLAQPQAPGDRRRGAD